MTQADLAKSMDALEACLRVYLPRDDVPPRMEALRSLLKERHFA